MAIYDLLKYKKVTQGNSLELPAFIIIRLPYRDDAYCQLFLVQVIAVKPNVYIGEAENCYERLKQHNRGTRKDFLPQVTVTQTNALIEKNVKSVLVSVTVTRILI